MHAGDQPRIDLTRRQLFADLAAEVVTDGKLVKSSISRWNEIDANLPSDTILVMAPEPNTTAAIAFQENALVEGCKTYSAISMLENAKRERVCRSVRQDRRIVNAAKVEYNVAAWLERNRNAVAALSYTMYRKLSHKTAVNLIEGIEPTDETIGNKTYPLNTSTYIYLKDQHAKAILKLQHCLYELTSERAFGPMGYVADLACMLHQPIVDGRE